MSLGFHDSFDFAELLGKLDQPAFAFGGAVFEIHAGHTARHQRAHRIAHTILITVASFTIGIKGHRYDSGKRAARLDELLSAHHLAVRIAQ